MDNCFEPEWVPSQQSDAVQTPMHPKPWNTLGIPLENKHPEENKIVRKAVRDIESGLYHQQPQDFRKEIVEEKIDISQAKLYWQEMERSSQDAKPLVGIDYRTDYPAEGERDDNVIVLKVEQSDGVILKPDRPVLVQPIELKRKISAKKRKDFREEDKENLPDYEKNWNEKGTAFWDSDFPVGSLRYLRRDTKEKAEDLASKVLKFERTGYPDEAGEVKTQIPRIPTGRICRVCKKLMGVEKCSKCGSFKYGSYGQGASKPLSRINGKYHSGRKKRETPEEGGWLSLDSQRSRTNFFGNSGSYTLRCNLNPISKTSFNRKKFYLTPETLQLDYLKKLKEPKIFYENFTAKKREFKKAKAGSIVGSIGSGRKSEAVMW